MNNELEPRLDNLERRLQALESTVATALEQVRVSLAIIERGSEFAERKLHDIEARLVGHIIEESGSVRRLFAASVVQFLVVLGSILFLIFEGKFGG